MNSEEWYGATRATVTACTTTSTGVRVFCKIVGTHEALLTYPREAINSVPLVLRAIAQGYRTEKLYSDLKDEDILSDAEHVDWIKSIPHGIYYGCGYTYNEAVKDLEMKQDAEWGNV